MKTFKMVLRLAGWALILLGADAAVLFCVVLGFAGLYGSVPAAATDTTILILVAINTLLFERRCQSESRRWRRLRYIRRIRQQHRQLPTRLVVLPGQRDSSHDREENR